MRNYLYNIELSFICLLALSVGATFGQSGGGTNGQPGRSDSTRAQLTGQRVMQMFDFEERGIHSEKLPMFWVKSSVGKGYPHYSRGQLDNSRKHGGQYSFKLIPDGGSVAFEYDRRQRLLRVKAGSDTQVNGYVHLEQAKGCRAQMICVLTDRMGIEIPDSFHASRLVSQSDHGPDGWAELDVYVPGNFPDARFMTVGVRFLQEAQWNNQVKDDNRIAQRNIHAVAWFDDIAVFQLPRVLLRSGKPSNVFDGNELATIQVEVEGVGTLDYEVKLTVSDANKRLIRDEAWVLTGVEGEVKIRTFELENLPAGLYHVKMDIYSAGLLIASRQLQFAKLSQLSSNPSRSGVGFGTIMMDNTGGDFETGIELTHLLSAQLIKIPVWRQNENEGGAIISSRKTDFDRKLLKMQQYNIKAVAVFEEVPDAMALKMDPGRRTLLDVLSQDVGIWRESISGVLARYALQVPNWQIGMDVFAVERQWDPRIKTVLATMKREFSKLVTNPMLSVPINSQFEVGQEQLGTRQISLGISSSVTPEYIPNYIDDFRKRNLDSIWAVIDPLAWSDYRRQDVLIDLAKRVAYAKKGKASAVFIDHPWKERQYNARSLTEPDETFLVFRTLADQLGGMQYIGEFELAPNVPALIFDNNGEGCLFAWDRRYKPLSGKSKLIEMNLGGQISQVDLFGNKQELPTSKGLTQLRMTNWPVLLTGINTHIAMLRSTLRLSPDIIDASIARQRLKLKFTNPFATPISGYVRFILDKQINRNWNVDPSSLQFSLDPGEEYSQEITMKFPSSELGGAKYLQALFYVDADKSYRFRADVPFAIELAEIDVSIFTQRFGENDLIVQQVVTNDSNKKVTLYSFIDLPDTNHIEQPISQLEPGATQKKNYRIRNARQWRGRYLRVGLYDPKGTRRINYRVKIE